MAVVTNVYLAMPELTFRTGLIEARYRVADGRFVINHQDLQRVRLTPQEMLNGLHDQIEEISQSDAQALIIENGYQLGPAKPEPVVEPDPEEEALQEEETPQEGNEGENEE